MTEIFERATETLCQNPAVCVLKIFNIFLRALAGRTSCMRRFYHRPLPKSLRRFYHRMTSIELSAIVGVDESRRPRSIFFYDGG